MSRAPVIISADDYDALLASKPSFVDALLNGPKWDDAFGAAVSQRTKAPSRKPPF